MKSKKSIIIILFIIIGLVLGGIFVFTKQDKNTSFTILSHYSTLTINQFTIFLIKCFNSKQFFNLI